MKTIEMIMKELVNMVLVAINFAGVKKEVVKNFFAPFTAKGRIETGEYEWSPKKWAFEYSSVYDKPKQCVYMDILVKNGRAIIAYGDISYHVHTGQLLNCNIRNVNCALRKIKPYIVNVIGLIGMANAIDRDATIYRKNCSPRVAKPKLAVANAEDRNFVEDKTKEILVSDTKITYVSTEIGDTSDIEYTADTWERRGHWRHYKSGKVVWIEPQICKRDPAKLGKKKVKK